ncbi:MULTISPECIES: hypothetical protein [Pseudomonas]|uniref:hypothetical protein n=1 Tax=Pseudomonas TaxID=286 RepID=UPI000D7013FD|nr:MULTISPECIES: hypothetical protein [unclassified Pseudomonas]PWU27097.1 hypothetical protein DK254_31805 [Pseudomonas sp. RW407]
MSGLFYPCTREDPMGLGPQGLLGEGELPWPEVVAARAMPSRINIGGEYATDDYSGAMFLAGELASADSDMSEEEAEESLALLVFLFGKLKQAGKTSAKEMEALRKQAEAIPVVGPLLFSASNLPGTVANVAGMMHAGLKTKRVVDLLDIPDKLKKELATWASTRGRSGSRSARKTFHRRIRLVHVEGNLKFRIPATETARLYRVGGEVVGDLLQVPAYDTLKDLRSRTYIDAKAYGTRGFGKVLSSNAVGAALSFGPQAYIDASNSHSVGEFLEKSAYSQVGNVAAFTAGFVVASLVAGPAVIVIGISLIAGAGAQFTVERFGADKAIGDFLTGKK